MSEAQPGDIICTAGRGTKCIHKRNASFLGGQVRGMICAIAATPEVCVKAGKEVK